MAYSKQSASNITQNTRVNLSILLTLLSMGVGGAFYCSALKTSVDSLQSSMIEVKNAIVANTTQIAIDGREAASLRAQVASLQRQVEDLLKR